MNEIKCRLFKMSVGWGDVIFFFPMDINFKEIRQNTRTFHLKKDNYIGTYFYDVSFLENIDKDKINNKDYFLFYFLPIDRH